MLRRLWAAALSALVVVAATAVAAAAQSPREEQERLTAADNALAARIALKRSDLGPGWTQRPAPAETSEDDWTCPGFNPDFSAFTITGKARTSFAQAGGASILSFVEVYPSRAQARGDFALGAKPAVARCLKLALERELEKAAGYAASVTSARMVRAPRVGERAAAYRVVVRIRAGGTSVQLFADVLAVQRGRSIVGFFFTSPARPLPNQVGIARRVAARMR